MEVDAASGWVWCGGRRFGPGLWLDRLRVEEGYRLADANLGSELEKFVINTLEYALKERHMILGGVSVPDIGVDIKGRQCLIAIRGANYLEDLEAVNSYIREARPTLIAVDGGADALIDRGFIPDIIIGDMDSVSDRALRCGAALVAHAYADGRSPGAERLKQAGLPHHVISCPGTSEDVAMLMAYQAGASLIVAVGSHSNMRDFLEKGRPGMGSTFLVRLLVGSILVDARGASQLYRSRLSPLAVLWIVLAACVPLAVLWRLSSPLASMARLVWLRLRLALGVDLMSLRHHLLSIAGIFLGLGLGILIGASVTSDQSLLARQQAMIDRLDADFAALSAERGALVKELDAYRRTPRRAWRTWWARPWLGRGWPWWPWGRLLPAWPR